MVSILFTVSCGIYKPSDARKVSPNVEDRVQKALEEGKGIRFGLGGADGNKNTNFEFSWFQALKKAP